MGCESNLTNKPDNFNVGAGDPDLGGGRGIPPPAEHVIARLEVLWHDNVVLVEALLELVIVDRPLVPPGAALSTLPPERTQPKKLCTANFSSGTLKTLIDRPLWLKNKIF